jgi:hypothetical protein
MLLYYLVLVDAGEWWDGEFEHENVDKFKFDLFCGYIG